MTENRPTESHGHSDGGMPAVRWLAGLAMQGLVQRHGVPDSESAREEFALWSYRMAQSMLAAEKQLHAIDDTPEAH